MQWTMGGEVITIEVEGPRAYGDNYVMLDQDDDLTHPSWREAGFVVAPFLNAELRQQLRDACAERLERILREVGYQGPRVDWAHYHKLAEAEPEIHRGFIDIMRRCMQANSLDFDTRIIDEAVSEQCGVRVSCASAASLAHLVCMRVVRPRSGDNNPPHRDVWFDRLRNGINIYAPLFGSNDQNSLPIIPGSHRWPESDIEHSLEGSKVNGVVFSVPSVTDAKRPLHFERPSVRDDEFMVFSPYTIHGGAKNQSPDTTRVSLEMRFFRVH